MAVCILGSINRDVVCRVTALPQAGETVAARETMLLPGGKGANQAVAAVRAGAQVRMIGAVGRDADGEALRAMLADEGVDVTAVACLSDAATGAAYIAVDDAGENQIVVAAGANARIDPAAIRLDAGDRVLLAQLEVPVAAVATFFAGGTGAYRILNAAPALPEARALLPDTDLLIVNETELAAYLGGPVKAIEADAVRALLPRADQAAVVTLGAAGMLVVDRNGAQHFPARRVAVVDTTGAGDCFCGVLAASIDEGRCLRESAVRAGYAASLCVGRAGAAPAMPYRAELEAAPSE